MADIRLIITDFDGTLVGRKNELGVFDPFRQKMADLAGTHGTVWAVNTGRTLRGFFQVFRPMMRHGMTPDYVIAEHAYVYTMLRHGAWPHLLWNLQTLVSVIRESFRSRRILMRYRRAIKRRFGPAVVMRRRGHEYLHLHFKDTGAMKEAIRVSMELQQLGHKFILTKHPTDIVVRTVPFTKGLASAHLSRHLGIPRENVLAIGDGLNDASMLDGNAAAMTACPANAAPEVKRIVHESGGHIADSPYLAGTLESINAHLSGTVRSDIRAADGDKFPGAGSQLPSFSRSARHHHSAADTVRETFLFFTVCATMLVVFASCGLLGPLSKWIMKPVLAAASMLGKLSVGL